MFSQAQKESNGSAYYKHWIDSYANSSTGYTTSSYKDLKRNYDLLNGIVDSKDYNHIIQPWGNKNKLPTKFAHRDIVSALIKRLIGIESSRIDSLHLKSLNKEATTRTEEEEYDRLKQYVLSTLNGNNEEETPEKIKKYIQREHQDISDVYGNHLIRLLKQESDTKYKFSRSWLHGLCSGICAGYVGINNKEVFVESLNPLYLDFDKSPDTPYIHKSQWVTYYYRLTPADVIQKYGSRLTKRQIKDILNYNNSSPQREFTHQTFGTDPGDQTANYSNVVVAHSVWKGLKKIGIITSINPETKLIEETIVDETYKFNEEIGDIALEWHWVEELHEATKIKDIYLDMRPVPNQDFDIDTLHESKDLPYIGVVFDDVNSTNTSIMSRLVPYQYLYNIIIYRVEKLMASDKGKILAYNLDLVPEHAGIDFEKWHYFTEANQIAWFSFAKAGNKFGVKDVNSQAKLIDMSLTSDIDKYIKLAEYIEDKAKKVVGLTQQFEGNIQAREGQQNVQHSINASNAALEPYFYMHSIFKKEMLKTALKYKQQLLLKHKPKNLAYWTDDIGFTSIQMDYDVLKNSKYNMYVSNTIKDEENISLLKQYASFAIQSDKLELSDFGKFLQSPTLNEGLEILEVGEAKRKEFQQKQAEIGEQLAAQREKDGREWEKEKIQIEHTNEIDQIKEKGKQDILKAAVTGTGFDEEKDRNNNDIPDIIEHAKHLLDKEKFEHTKQKENRELDQKDKEINTKPKSK